MAVKVARTEDAPSGSGLDAETVASLDLHKQFAAGV